MHVKTIFERGLIYVSEDVEKVNIDIILNFEKGSD